MCDDDERAKLMRQYYAFTEDMDSEVLLDALLHAMPIDTLRDVVEEAKLQQQH